MTAQLVFSLFFGSSQLWAQSDETLRKAAQALDLKDFVSASRYFEEALKTDPGNVSILSSLGFSLAGTGRFADAARRFREATQLEPAVGAHHYNLGLALFQTSDYKAAETEFHATIRLSPDHPRAMVQYGNALLAQGQQGAAGKTREAAEAYAKALPRNRNDPELHFNLALALARTGDEAGSLLHYREVVKLAPDFPRGQFFLGVTLFQLEKWAEAVAPLKAAIAHGQKDFHVHYYLGSALLKLRDLEGAGVQLNQAAAIKPDDPGVHFQLAALYRATGSRLQANEHLRAFRDLSARQEAQWRADALEQAAQRALQQGNLVEVSSALQQAFDSSPSVSSARNLALVHLQRGDRDGARKFLKAALDLDPSDGPTHNYLGLLEAQEGNLTAAEAYFEKAMLLDPSLTDARYNAGVAAIRLDQPQKAVGYLSEAVKRSDEPRIRKALATALADAGRIEEAQAQFDEAQKQDIARGGP